MFSKKFLLSVGAVAGAAMLSANVQAGSVISLMQLGPNTFEDSNREFLLNRVGSATSLDVGDSLGGILRFVQSNGGLPDVGITDNSWDVVFQALITSRTVTGIAPNGVPIVEFGYAPDPTFMVNGALAGPGVMGVFFEDAPLTTNLGDGNDNGGTPLTIAAATATVTNGTRFWSVGMTGAAAAIPALDGLADWDNSSVIDAGDTGFLFTTPDLTASEGWLSQTSAFGVGLGVNGTDISVLNTVPQSPGFVTFNAGLSRILNGAIVETGDPILLNNVFTGFGPNPFLGTFSLSGFVGGTQGLGGTNFDATSQTTLAFNIERIVPEPITSTMGLMGLGALSMIARRRRIA